MSVVDAESAKTTNIYTPSKNIHAIRYLNLNVRKVVAYIIYNI